MQVDDAGHGTSTTQRRGPRTGLQTIVVIAVALAIVALMALAGVLMSSGSGAENVTP